jgi:hypothetical protein
LLTLKSEPIHYDTVLNAVERCCTARPGSLQSREASR